MRMFPSSAKETSSRKRARNLKRNALVASEGGPSAFATETRRPAEAPLHSYSNRLPIASWAAASVS
jgi:hypothetical protein